MYHILYLFEYFRTILLLLKIPSKYYYICENLTKLIIRFHNSRYIIHQMNRLIDKITFARDEKLYCTITFLDVTTILS